MLCKLPFKGITRERILLALAHKGFKKKGEFEHELRVVYELVQGNKLHKERLKVRCFVRVSCRDLGSVVLGVKRSTRCSCPRRLPLPSFFSPLPPKTWFPVGARISSTACSYPFFVVMVLTMMAFPYTRFIVCEWSCIIIWCVRVEWKIDGARRGGGFHGWLLHTRAKPYHRAVVPFIA